MLRISIKLQPAHIFQLAAEDHNIKLTALTQLFQQTAAVLEAGALQRRALLLQVVLFHPQLLAVVASKGDLQRFCCVLTLHATRRLSA